MNLSRSFGMLTVGVCIYGAVPLASATEVGQSQCEANFTVSPDRAGFSTFVESRTGDREEMIENLAQQLAIEGFASISASKDVGVVSAVQMSGNPARPCPLNFRFKRLKPKGIRIDTSFRLGAGLVSSPPAVRAALCKIIREILPQSERGLAAADAAGTVIQTDSGYAALEGVSGEFRQRGIPPVVLFFMVFQGGTSAVSTSLPRPTIRLAEQVPDVKKRFALVRLETDESDARSLKIGSARAITRAIFTGNQNLPPDPDWRVAYSAMKDDSGVWTIVPDSDLRPGEYGLYDLDGHILFSFRRQ